MEHQNTWASVLLPKDLVTDLLVNQISLACSDKNECPFLSIWDQTLPDNPAMSKSNWGFQPQW